MTAHARILVVDDEPLLRAFLEETVLQLGHTVILAASAQEAIEQIQVGTPDLIMLDIRMKGRDGLSLLPELRQRCPNAPVMMMTGHGTVESAVQALRLGAFDYLTKPFSADAIEIAVQRALSVGALKRENEALRGRLSLQNAMVGLIGRSRPMEELKSTLKLVAPSRSTVLIQGESGTGKELVSRAVHEGSPRSDKPFIKINCAAVPSGLLESELFGHEKGAFTGAVGRTKGKFEQADGGTLLLDEISEMDVALQPKLLRALQEREFYRVGGREPVRVDVRVLATTNADLRDRVSEGSFREDLFYRLNVVPVRVAPLRNRREDIPLLAKHFLSEVREDSAEELRISRGAMEALLAYDWPGNIRELMNAVERATILCAGTELLAEHFVLEMGSTSTQSGPVGDTIAEREKSWILEILEKENGNRTRTAKRLGVSVRTIRNKLSLYAKQRAAEEEQMRAESLERAS